MYLQAPVWAFLITLCSASALELVQLGAKYPATKGEIWPRPQVEKRSLYCYTVDPQNLAITSAKHTCRILDKAMLRYQRLVQRMADLLDETGQGHRHRAAAAAAEGTAARGSTAKKTAADCRRSEGIRSLTVHLSRPCEEYPYLGMDESYNLTVSAEATLYSDSVWGALRGLESFSQLIYLPDDYSEVRIRESTITDAPRYQHRGLHLDTARHFISVRNILTLLDAMEYNKMNVFHWHIVDDQSFPYQSKRYPKLSDLGAYSDNAVYSPRDVALVVEYARLRGVRVMPEFDMPGHTRSWGAGYKDLLTQCYERGKPAGLGPMDPTKNSTYSFLQDFVTEVRKVFPDQYIHIGGDEVNTECWSSNPEIAQYVREHPGERNLEAMFLQRLVALLPADRSPVVWEEAFYGGAKLSKETIVQKWKFWEEKPEDHKITQILKAGHRVLYSSAMYLDFLKSSNEDPGDWWKYYAIELADKVEGAGEAERGVLGGEACMWAEGVDDTNVVSRVWPRASAAAEKLWSAREATRINFKNASAVEAISSRLQEHACRMRRRNVAAQPPAGASYCLTRADLPRRRHRRPRAQQAHRARRNSPLE